MRALLTMLVAAVLATGCGGDDSAPSAPAERSADGVVELSSAAQITERFDADRGKPRLLLIFSPT